MSQSQLIKVEHYFLDACISCPLDPGHSVIGVQVLMVDRIQCLDRQSDIQKLGEGGVPLHQMSQVIPLEYGNDAGILPINVELLDFTSLQTNNSHVSDGVPRLEEPL